MIWQLGWTTLPGLRGLSVSEFRAAPTTAPDNVGGIAIEFANEAERDAFLQRLEAEFASRRFTNAADAFDTVRGFALQQAGDSGEVAAVTDARKREVRILKRHPENLSQAKDEEYAYWQSRPPLERLLAMQELSFAFYEGRDDEAETRRQFLRSPRRLAKP